MGAILEPSSRTYPLEWTFWRPCHLKWIFWRPYLLERTFLLMTPTKYPPRFVSLTIHRCDTNYIGYSFTSSFPSGQYCCRPQCSENKVIVTVPEIGEDNVYTDCCIACGQTKCCLVQDILYGVLQILKNDRQCCSKYIFCFLCDIVLYSQAFDSFLYMTLILRTRWI